MSGWAGFSDEELRKLQQKAGPPMAARGRKAAPPGRNRQQLQRERALQAAAERSAADGHLSVTPGQQLTVAPQPGDVQSVAAPAGAPVEKIEKMAEPSADEPQLPCVKELETAEVEIREKTRLEQLQQDQKHMEEKNKRKKALLAKTIAEKSKQTQAEAVKLKRIQKELQALDELVSNDINILRGKIEQASWEYSGARKRYEKAEAEYVAAKLELHHKTEVKEQLTEHLYAIIQQNELRKANKLEELMEQLQLQAEEEEERRKGAALHDQEGGKKIPAEGEKKSIEQPPPISEDESGGGLGSKTEMANASPNQMPVQMVTS